jgi:hypothetical protein
VGDLVGGQVVVLAEAGTGMVVLEMVVEMEVVGLQEVEAVVALVVVAWGGLAASWCLEAVLVVGSGGMEVVVGDLQSMVRSASTIKRKKQLLPVPASGWQLAERGLGVSR